MADTNLINADRLWQRVQSLAALTLLDQPWTRRAFTALHLQARAELTRQMQAAGLQVRVDAAGNLVGMQAGQRSDVMPLRTGSHCDTVLSGGRFDGIIGVLAGIEVAHSLFERGERLMHPLEVIDFLSEEPSDYGISCVGSRGLIGALDATMLSAVNPTGETLAQGMRRMGAEPEALGTALLGAGSTAAFVELHIEQGPVLETRQLPVGVVTNIVGIRRYNVSVLGQPDHAGTTPMDIRRDALVGAAQIITAVHQRAQTLQSDQHYLVATVGYMNVLPNASNAVPGRVDLMLELRSDKLELLADFSAPVFVAAELACKALRLDINTRQVSHSMPTDCSLVVMDAIEASARDLDYTSMRMPSGAGHDAVYLAKTGPMGMIFIPCLKGRSHCPEEWIEPEQLAVGAEVLLATLQKLDQVLLA
jgi:beta-ureidopropionase / N-carbamoyl-L-amino-acid hydrolase